MHIPLPSLLMSIALTSGIVCVSSVRAQNYAPPADARAQQVTPDADDAIDAPLEPRRDVTPNVDGIGIAQPANGAAGATVFTDGDEMPAPVRRITRPARRGTATGAQKPAAPNGQQHIPYTVTYGNGNLYSNGRGRDLYRTPW